jgi:hypothetical protein
MYVLVTNWTGYWDEINGQTSYYPNGLIHVEINNLRENVDTVFIKIDGARRILNGWRGTVNRITRQVNRTSFHIQLGESISTNHLIQYEGFGPGWYEVDVNYAGPTNEDNNRFTPNFFNEFDTIVDPYIFEDLVYKLIRVLGIHRVYQFSRDGQAGRADGFFKFLNLAVIYDCTLSQNYLERKRQQIINYCNQLLAGQIEILPNIIERVHNHQKQVWIITRGTSHILQNIG